MRDVAEAIRPDVKTAINPVPLYPFRKLGTVPTLHAQLYAGSESHARRALPEYDAIIYLHLYAVREEDIADMQTKLRWLDGHMVPGIVYNQESANLLQEPDGTLHLAMLYSARYFKVAA